MRIVVYGDQPSAGSGVWCYMETLREMGHEVLYASAIEHIEFYSQTLPGRALQRIVGRPLEMHRARHGASLVAAAAKFKAEIVVVMKGLRLAGSDIRALRDQGAWVVLVNHDDFFSLNPNNRSDTQRAAVPYYDFIFATRLVNVDEVRPLNPNVEFFPFAYYPRIHRPVPISDAEEATWRRDVVFVGTWEEERAALLEHLVQVVPANYSIWGNTWSRVSANSPLRRYIRNQSVHTDDMAKALGGAEISLGFLRKLNRDDYTQRTFEIPACGGLLLGERTSTQMSILAEDVEAAYFEPTDPAELCYQVERLLKDPAHRLAMRDAGRRAVLAGRHTYRDRLERLLALYHEAPR